MAERAANGSYSLTDVFSSAKFFTRMVAAELDALELKHLREHLALLKQFLPDNFGRPGGDHDCVLLTVFFPRMAEKAELMSRLLLEKFPGVPGGMTRDHVVLSHKAEQWSHAKRFEYHLARVCGVLRRFE